MNVTWRGAAYCFSETICQSLYLKTLDENTECVQHSETHLSGNIRLQQTLAAQIGFCVRVDCMEITLHVKLVHKIDKNSEMYYLYI